jgi:hypothetical protein
MVALGVNTLGRVLDEGVLEGRGLFDNTRPRAGICQAVSRSRPSARTKLMLIWIVVAPGTEHSLARRAVKHAFKSAFRPNPLALRQSSRHSPTRVSDARIARGYPWAPDLAWVMLA